MGARLRALPARGKGRQTVTLPRLAFDASAAAYEQQAEELLAGHRSGDVDALRLIHGSHPRFLDEQVKWLPKKMEVEEIRSAPFDAADARLALARWYIFQDWPALADYATAAAHRGSLV